MRRALGSRSHTTDDNPCIARQERSRFGLIGFALRACYWSTKPSKTALAYGKQNCARYSPAPFEARKPRLSSLSVIRSEQPLEEHLPEEGLTTIIWALFLRSSRLLPLFDRDLMSTMLETLHSPASFLGLPLELREQIYSYLLCSQLNKLPVDSDRLPAGVDYALYRYDFDLSILRLNHQIYNEARRIFRLQNVFIRIETPWLEAEGHVANQGRVPLLATGERAAKFADYHLAINIDIPDMEAVQHETTKFVICVEDLHLFCKMWMYSDLSHPGLNAHLRLQLTIRNPAQEYYAEELSKLPTLIQRRLLEPFGIVKGLRSFLVKGDHDQDIEKAVRDSQATPHKSPEQCLEEANKLKDAGNIELKNGNYREALRLYESSFLAVHIVVSGRYRCIWADAFFEADQQNGSNNMQRASVDRMYLRIKLVANIILAYNNLHEYEEAKFWGLRSIALMRQLLGPMSDEPRPGFPAADAWGKVYYRTAMACKGLDDMIQAREFLRIAGLWLPRDEVVKREIAACAPRLG